MKRLLTTTGAFLTDDAIADAILEYWLALSKDQVADVIDMPFLDHEDRVCRVRLGIGWGLGIAAVDVDDARTLADDGLLGILRDRGEERTRAREALLLTTAELPAEWAEL